MLILAAPYYPASQGVVFTTRAEYVWFFGVMLAQACLWLYHRIRYSRGWDVPYRPEWTDGEPEGYVMEQLNATAEAARWVIRHGVPVDPRAW